MKSPNDDFLLLLLLLENFPLAAEFRVLDFLGFEGVLEELIVIVSIFAVIVYFTTVVIFVFCLIYCRGIM